MELYGNQLLRYSHIKVTKSMVNAIICDLNLPNNREETDFFIAYLRQLHFFHGFDRIFVSKSAVDLIREWTSIDEEKYLRTLDQTNGYELVLARELEQELGDILWQMKKTDIYEANLSSLPSLYALWSVARRLESLIVQPMSTTTGDFSRIIHLLAGTQREFIGNLADDIELWLLCHFADIYVDWPYFLSFPKQIIEEFQREKLYWKNQNHFVDSRTKICGYAQNRMEYRKRESMISGMQKYFNHLTRWATEKHGQEVIINRTSIAVSNAMLSALEKTPLNYPALIRYFKKTPQTKRIFDPCFLNIKLYPLDLVKSASSNGLMNEGKSPFSRYGLFQTAQEVELELVLSRFKKRLKISGMP
jgi:hypothetical protein